MLKTHYLIIMSKKDYYELLGVSKSASAGDIKKAYFQLAKKYHPDQNKGDKDAEQKFKEITEAYEVLKDDQKKAAYDRFGHDAFAQGGGGRPGAGSGFQGGGFHHGNFDDIFGDFFNEFMGGGSRSRRGSSGKARGSDLTTKLEITLEEAFIGIKKELRFSTQATCHTCNGNGSGTQGGVVTCDLCGGAGIVRMQQGFFAIEQTCHKCQGAGQIIKDPCGTCHGNGRINKEKKLLISIPAGAEDGLRIRHAGEGEAGFRGGPSGDLYVFLTVKEHDVFKVHGSDLHFKLSLTLPKAALGCTVKVPTIEGQFIELKVPAGTETGDKLRIRGKGMTKVNANVRGDLYAHAFIETPKNLTKKQKELLEQLDKEFGNEEANYNSSSFFSKMKNLWS